MKVFETFIALLFTFLASVPGLIKLLSEDPLILEHIIKGYRKMDRIDQLPKDVRLGAKDLAAYCRCVGVDKVLSPCRLGYSTVEHGGTVDTCAVRVTVHDLARMGLLVGRSMALDPWHGVVREVTHRTAVELRVGESRAANRRIATTHQEFEVT